MENIGLETTNAFSGDIHNLSIPAVVGVLFLVLILGVISSRWLRLHGLAVHNLFLKISFTLRDHDAVGYVRSLDVNRMQLVMNERPKKGELITLELSSLSGFPAAQTTVDGTIVSTKPIAKNTNSFLVTVAINVPPGSNDAASNLVSYLHMLGA
jgi:hypothetical protein